MGCSGSKPAEQETEGKTQIASDQRAERTYGAWAQSEENDEQAYLKSQKTALTVHDKLAAKFPEKQQEKQDRRRQQAATAGKGTGELPAQYSAPHVKAPWTLEQADALLDFYVQTPNAGSKGLHVSYAAQLLRAAIDVFRPLPSVLRMDVPPPDSGKTLIVVGDTHGQLADVLYVFATHGPPSPTNWYLFNGDIADRGTSAVEIWLLLLSYKLACNECVHINRGNHENNDMNQRPAMNGGGFGSEVRSKYSREIFELFQELFCTLPLATVIGAEAFVVHGGLCRLNPSLEQMSRVARERQCPDAPGTNDETIIFDSLWADPAADGDPSGSGRGGACYAWDEAATAKFLSTNKLSLIIRSHQLPDKQRGYMLHHSNKVMTLFTATNYCGVCGNRGAVLILRAGSSTVWEFKSPPHDQLPKMWAEAKAKRQKAMEEDAGARVAKRKHSIRELAVLHKAASRWGGHAKDATMMLGQQRGSAAGGLLSSTTISSFEPDADAGEKQGSGMAGMDVAIIRQLKERICLHRAELLQAFHKTDKNGDGLIAVAKWQEIVSRVLGVPVDWSLVGPALVQPEPAEKAGGKKDMVDFVKSLERYQIRLHQAYAGWQASVLSKVYAALQKSDLSIDSLKARFDKDADGSVTAAEVLEVLLSFDLALSRPQLERALLWMDMGEGGAFEADKFISQLFVMCHDGVQAELPAGSSPSPPVSRKDSMGSTSAYHGDGTITLPDGSSVDGVRYLSQLLTTIVDTDRDGNLSATELHAVSQKLWGMIDTDGDGYLSYDEFADGVLHLLKTHEAQLGPTATITRGHAKYLARRIDLVKTGRICFLEFLPLFSAASTNEGTELQGSNSALIQHICTHIYEQQQALAKAFHFFDKEEDLSISPEDFVSAVAMVGEVIANGMQANDPFTRDQIETLASHCPRDEHGHIKYQDFLDAFVVVDLHVSNADDTTGHPVLTDGAENGRV